MICRADARSDSDARLESFRSAERAASHADCRAECPLLRSNLLLYRDDLLLLIDVYGDKLRMPAFHDCAIVLRLICLLLDLDWHGESVRVMQCVSDRKEESVRADAVTPLDEFRCVVDRLHYRDSVALLYCDVITLRDPVSESEAEYQAQHAESRDERIDVNLLVFHTASIVSAGGRQVRESVRLAEPHNTKTNNQLSNENSLLEFLGLETRYPSEAI